MSDASASSQALPAIAVTPVAGSHIETVDARELHAFLEVGKDFSSWIKERIEAYGFAAGADFISYDGLSSPVSGSAKARPQKTVEYALTLGMAKELCMVERNARGREARRYFIECERRAKAPPAPQFVIPQTLGEALQLAADLAREVEVKDAELAAAKPKLAALERIASNDGSLNLTETAKLLGVKLKDLIRDLQASGWIYRRAGGRSWLGYADREKAGLLTHKHTPLERADGTEKIAVQVRFLSKGLTKLAERYAGQTGELFQ